MFTNWLGLPPLATTHGQQIDNLIGWVHVFMFVLFIGWGALFVYMLIRFRRSRQPVAVYAPVRSRELKYVEAGWLGRKSQRGFYDYRGEKPVPTR